MARTQEIIFTDNTNVTWRVVGARLVKQVKVGRPRNKQAKFELAVVRATRGTVKHKSYLYTDGTFCQPF